MLFYFWMCADIERVNKDNVTTYSAKQQDMCTYIFVYKLGKDLRVPHWWTSMKSIDDKCNVLFHFSN